MCSIYVNSDFCSRIEDKHIEKIIRKVYSTIFVKITLPNPVKKAILREFGWEYD